LSTFKDLAELLGSDELAEDIINMAKDRSETIQTRGAEYKELAHKQEHTGPDYRGRKNGDVLEFDLSPEDAALVKKFIGELRSRRVDRALGRDFAFAGFIGGSDEPERIQEVQRTAQAKARAGVVEDPFAGFVGGTDETRKTKVLQAEAEKKHALPPGEDRRRK